MAETERRKLNEDELFFYEDKVCGEADFAYRFCYALTLNQESAQKLLLMTYKDIAGQLKPLIGAGTSKLRAALLRAAFAKHNDSAKKGAAGSSPVAGLLGSLPVDVRAALYAVDVAGMTVTQASEVFGHDEQTFRRKLAVGRKALILDKNFD